jgi:hypothetical protein
MQRPLFVFFCASWLFAASACGDDERPAASLEGNSGRGGSGAGAEPGLGGSDAQPDAGSGAAEAGAANGGAPSGGQGGGAGEGIDYELAGAPSVSPGVCDPNLAPTDDQVVDAAVASATLLSMTPDERTLALVTGEAPELVLHVADRASLDDAFEAREVTLPEGYEAGSGVALSSDALTLVLVKTDHSGFGSISRAARGEAFSTEVDVTAFSRINAQKAMSGRELGWPVLSGDGSTLYFLSYRGPGVVVQSTRQKDGRFDLGFEHSLTLSGDEGANKQVTAVSADQRTIFYFDQGTSRASARSRSRPDAPFYDPVDLGDREGVTPSSDCTRLYSSTGGKLVVQALN